MAMPLGTFGGLLAADQASIVGLSDAPLVLPFGALIVLASCLLAAAGSTLLWWKKQRPQKLAPLLPRARRREMPRPRITAPIVYVKPQKRPMPVKRPVRRDDVGMVTTALVPFGGTQRKVRVTARA